MTRPRRLAIMAASAAALLAATANAQTARDEFEFSTAAFFQSTKPAESTESDELLSIPLRIGYFFTDELELEGEVTLSHRFDTTNGTGVTSAGRLAYHFSNSAVVPFVFAGGGVGNGVEIGQFALDTGETRLHWQVGGGIKGFVADNVAIRADYRFARFADTIDSPVLTDAVNTHRVFVGLSLFGR